MTYKWQSKAGLSCWSLPLTMTLGESLLFFRAYVTQVGGSTQFRDPPSSPSHLPTGLIE